MLVKAVETSSCCVEIQNMLRRHAVAPYFVAGAVGDLKFMFGVKWH